MEWTNDQRDQFTELMVKFWPPSKRTVPDLINEWSGELSRFTFDQVEKALRHVKRKDDTRQTPTIARVRKACDEIRSKERGGTTSSASSERDRLVARFGVLGLEGATWINPKTEIEYELNGAGILWTDDDGDVHAHAMGDLPTPFLARVLEHGESYIRRPPKATVGQARAALDRIIAGVSRSLDVPF